jgi:hypothetical protein
VGDRAERGVAIVVHKSVLKSVVKRSGCSYRIIAVKLKAEQGNILITQVYMPTSECEEEVEELYDIIEEILKEDGKGKTNTFIMGVWNSVVGDKAHHTIVGPYGMGRRNQRGQMLIDFCERNGPVITNIWLKKAKRRLYTWKAPGDRSRHQLDYVLVKQRFRNSVKNGQTLPGADTDSDYNLLVAKIYTRLNKIMFPKAKTKMGFVEVYAQRQKVNGSLEEKLGAIKCESGTVEVQWNNIKKCVLDIMSDLVGKVERRGRMSWITQQTISKMDERRKWKNVNNKEGKKNYRRLRNELKRATDNTKKEYLESICSGIVEFQRTGRYDLMYMKIKELSWKENHGIQNITSKTLKGI